MYRIYVHGSLIMQPIILCLFGSIIGLLMGCFGGSIGSLVTSSAIFFYIKTQDYPTILTNSMFLIWCISVASAFSHIRFIKIPIKFLAFWCLFTTAGGLIGVYAVHFISKHMILYFCVIPTFASGIYKFFNSFAPIHPHRLKEHPIEYFNNFSPFLALPGFIFGILATVGGTGFSVYALPYIEHAYKVNLQQIISINTITVLTFLTIITSTLIFSNDKGISILHYHVLAYILITAAPFAHIGSHLSRKIPLQWLQRIFATLLLTVACFTAFEILR